MQIRDGLNLSKSEIQLRDKLNAEAAGNWHKIFEIKKDIKLYHYTSQQGLEGILASNSLWFTDAENLNDKSEGKYIYSLLEAFLPTYKKGEGFEIFKGDIKENIIEIEDKSIFSYNHNGSNLSNMFPHYLICSFCKDKDALAMWNYYSKSVNKIGYNVKFSLNDLKEALNDIKESTGYPILEYRSFKVIYSLKSQRRLLRQILDFYYDKWTNENSKKAVLSSLAQFLHSIKFAIKHPAFSPEKEVRIIIKIVDENFNLKSDKIQVRPADNGFIPYMEVPFKNKDIRHIKASPLTDNYESVKYILQKYGYNGVDVDKSDIPLRF